MGRCVGVGKGVSVSVSVGVTDSECRVSAATSAPRLGKVKHPSARCLAALALRRTTLQAPRVPPPLALVPALVPVLRLRPRPLPTLRTWYSLSWATWYACALLGWLAAPPSCKLTGGSRAQIQANPDVISRVGAVFKFDITGAGVWTVDLKNGSGGVTKGDGAKPDCTFTTTAGNFVDLMSGKANPQKLFMSGKLKLKGNMGKAMKLGELRKLKSKL